MALIGVAALIGQHPFAEAAHRVHHHQSSQFPTGEDVVPDADLLVHNLVNDPLVDPFIAVSYTHLSAGISTMGLVPDGSLFGVPEQQRNRPDASQRNQGVYLSLIHI